MLRGLGAVAASAALWVASHTAAAQQQAPAGMTGDLSQCINVLRHELPQHAEVHTDTFDTYTSAAQDLRPVIDKATSSQPEFKLFIWDYLARRTDAQRVAEGRALMEREAGALAAIWQRHAVDAATVVAVFGVETDYGKVHGRYPVVDATLSRACLNLASGERKNHFFAALWLLQQGLVKPDEFRGSWAGAFGMTQFMPGTFTRYMDDGDGSGAPDIINSVPDALATTARYLSGLGWADGVPWGVEVKLPPALAQQPLNALESDHACLASAVPNGKCRTFEQWSALGITSVEGKSLNALSANWPQLTGSTRAALLMPAGAEGPAWLVTPNYQAIWRYNRADAYALAIGLLSDALGGGAPQRTPWPTDDPGVSRAELRELQALLLQRGHCEVTVDGAEGPRTSAAIRVEETRHGWPDTGRAGGRLLNALRADAQEQAAAAPVPAAASSASAAQVGVEANAAGEPVTCPVPAPR